MIRARGADPAATLDALRTLGYVVRDLEGHPVDTATILAPDLIRVTAQPA
jgi:hypothetical protein